MYYICTDYMLQIVELTSHAVCKSNLNQAVLANTFEAMFYFIFSQHYLHWHKGGFMRDNSQFNNDSKFNYWSFWVAKFWGKKDFLQLTYKLLSINQSISHRFLTTCLASEGILTNSFSNCYDMNHGIYSVFSLVALLFCKTYTV